ncbi:MAG: thiamine-binding protein [Psychroflexus sp.]|nr:thiamine-binding protein [Psychroflexus sp.]
MKISVELTLTPIQDDYEPVIIQLIKNLRKSGLRVLENPLSTQVYGDYDQVMEVLNEEVKTAMEGMERGLIHMKIVKSDRQDYEPHF